MKKTICIIGMAIGVILTAVGWFVLPDTVAVQFGFDGEVSNTMAKAPGLLVPLAICVIGGIIGIKAEEDGKVKGVVVNVIGVIAIAVMLILNLKLMR